MIIPIQPVPVRVSINTQYLTSSSYAQTDIDVDKMILEADSNLYELNLCYETTSLYRSVTYNVHKSSRAISWLIMVQNDWFFATLNASNKRLTFYKVPTMDADQVQAIAGAQTQEVLNSSGLSVNTYTVGYSSERLCVEFFDEATASFLFSVWAVGDTTGNAEQVFCTKVPSKNFLAKSTPSLFTVTQDSENTNLYYIACKTSGYTTTLNVTKIIDTSGGLVSLYMEESGG